MEGTSGERVNKGALRKNVGGSGVRGWAAQQRVCGADGRSSSLDQDGSVPHEGRCLRVHRPRTRDVWGDAAQSVPRGHATGGPRRGAPSRRAGATRGRGRPRAGGDRRARTCDRVAACGERSRHRHRDHRDLSCQFFKSFLCVLSGSVANPHFCHGHHMPEVPPRVRHRRMPAYN